MFLKCFCYEVSVPHELVSYFCCLSFVSDNLLCIRNFYSVQRFRSFLKGLRDVMFKGQYLKKLHLKVGFLCG